MARTCPTCGHPTPSDTTLLELAELVANGAHTVRQVALALYDSTTPADMERARRRLSAAVRAGQLQVVDRGGPEDGLTGARPALYGLTAALPG